jgi:WD40 repeat protein
VDPEIGFSFGGAKRTGDSIIAVDKTQANIHDEDLEDDYGPMPPPQATQDDDDDFGPAPPPVEAPKASPFDNFRKRKVERVSKSSATNANTASSSSNTGTGETGAQRKRPDSWYVWGKDDIPDGGEDETSASYDSRMKQVAEATPSGDFDMSVLMDEQTTSRLPIRYEAYLRAHTKAISALAIDPSGVRLVSASADFSLKFWDFSSMDPTLQSFRSLEPTENNIVHTVEWSKQGDKMLIAANTPQAQILDRDGRKLFETPRGYQFTTDMTHTTGHISAISRACWNPADASMFITCGQDSTIRFWNIEDLKKHKTLIKVKNERGLSNAKPQCMGISSSGATIAIACEDGSIQVFPTKGPYLKPSIRILNAHSQGSDTSWLEFVPDKSNDNILTTRGGDDTLKLWDLRNTKSALASYSGLYNRFAQTSAIFSPDGEILATGTSSTQNGDPGAILFVEVKSLKPLRQIEVSPESVISLRWHRGNNQIMAGSGDGRISVHFDPESSSKGVMTAITKPLRRLASQKTSEIDIITPLAPQELTDRQRAAQARKDPSSSHRAQEPVTGRGSAGMLGTNLKADFMKKVMSGGRDVHEDPREALLRQAEKSTASNTTIYDHEGLERINQAEKKRAEALEKAERSRGRS